ncbi:MAG: hypothetical protein NZ789_17000 [Pseudomonadales bacterium]|nr:hypothetical protein [Pseudomonadales bacterium]
MVAVTSEPQYLADEAEQDWELSYKVVGDPHQEIRQTLAGRGWLDIYRNQNWQHFGNDRDWARHPKGYYQPAVIAVTKEGRVLYRWRCVPRHSNISGAGARPAANYVWKQIQESLRQSDDAPIDEDPVMTSKDPFWPLFLMFLMAHGWFLKPKVFPLQRGTEERWVHPKKMIPRIFGFIGAWTIAALTLPLTWVGVAAAVWVAIVIPGIIDIHQKFQHID